MSVTHELHYASLIEIGAAMARREVSAVEVTRAQLERIELLNPALHAYWVVFGDQALADAARADAELASGRRRGPLHGVPIAFKDLYELGPTTAGSALLKDNVASREAAIVTSLREQGAVILGKLATHEFALSAATLNDAFPAARNPWNPDLTPGGSSTGAGTALAAGLAYGAFGSDTGGSVRIPAAHCAVVGLKPTFGLLSRTGIMPLAWSLDHAGPMARGAADATAMFLAAAGHDPSDPSSSRHTPGFAIEQIESGIRGVRFGVPRDFWEPRCDPEIKRVFELALEPLRALGATIVDVDLRVSLEQAIAIGYLIMLSEAAAHHAPEVRLRPELYGREFRLLMKLGLTIPARTYLAAQRARRVIAGRVGAVFGACDLLLMPTLGLLADPLPEGPRPVDKRISVQPAQVHTWLVNLYGGPAVSVPCGFSGSGLPIGLQVAGRPFDDLAVLTAARAFESATDWHLRRPQLRFR